MVNIERQ